jgi:hypothetical protein
VVRRSIAVERFSLCLAAWGVSASCFSLATETRLSKALSAPASLFGCPHPLLG